MVNLQQVSIRMAPDQLQHHMANLPPLPMVLLRVAAIKIKLQMLAPLQEVGMGEAAEGINSSNRPAPMVHHQQAVPMGQAGVAISMGLHKGVGEHMGNQHQTTGLATLPLRAMKRLPRLSLSTA